MSEEITENTNDELLNQDNTDNEQTGENTDDNNPSESQQEPENKEETGDGTEEGNITEENSDKEKEDYSKVQDAQEATNILEKKGFNYNDLANEYYQTGKISDETRKALADVGIAGDIVDNFIAGQEAKAEVERNEMAECIGGRKVFDDVLKWASTNLSQEEITSINAVRDKNIIRMILKDLKVRMEEKEGKTPEYTKGDTASSTATDIFHSQVEMFEAISDPQYKKNPAYRLKVQQKITASREAGIDLGI